PAKRRDGRTAPCSSSAMSFRAGYSLAGCSPAEPASASPTALSLRWGMSAGNYMSANGNLSLVSVSQHKGAVQASQRPGNRWTVIQKGESRLKAAAARIGRPAQRQAATKAPSPEGETTSPTAWAVGSRSQLTSPGTGRKKRRCRNSFAPFRGFLCLSPIPSADALGYFLSSYGLGPRQNRRGLRRIGNGVIRSSAYTAF